ncbi:unnamed protein product [Rhodiola kirilowii]
MEFVSSVKNILILDSKGGRVAVKYYTDEWPTVSKQKQFEKAVFKKARKEKSILIEGEDNTIALGDNISVYTFSNDLHFFVTGSEDENDLILSEVLNGFLMQLTSFQDVVMDRSAFRGTWATSFPVSMILSQYLARSKSRFVSEWVTFPCKMSSLRLCNTASGCLTSSPFPTPRNPRSLCKLPFQSDRVTFNCWEKSLYGALTGAALSLSLLISPPSFAGVAGSSVPIAGLDSVAVEKCVESEAEEILGKPPEVVSNKELVEEAWRIVNETFLNAGRRPWSPEVWLEKKENILGTEIRTRSKAHDVILKMLASLGDPYTRFLTPEEFHGSYCFGTRQAVNLGAFSRMSRYDITGIGINIREVPDNNGGEKLKVLGVILDGPAHIAGVRQGDEVLAVNGVDVRGKSAFEVSSMLQGPNETYVTIEVKHEDCGPIRSYKVQRQSVARTPVSYRLEKTVKGATSVGYVRLKEFNALARKDLAIAVKRLSDMGASYFILDLRDNLGGLVQAGVEITKLFLDEGNTVISTVGRDSQPQDIVSAGTTPLVSAPLIVRLSYLSNTGLNHVIVKESLCNMRPLLLFNLTFQVLVNNKTASASEIVASALHDNCKAVLVGDKTYGKGLIQSVFELSDGSGLVVTVGKYVTRNHMDINGNGILPDFHDLPAWSDVSQHLSECRRSRQS